MITFQRGDLFQDKAQALVNPVNCVGVMGKGLALEFRKRFPDNFREYAQACRRNLVQPGRMFVFNTYQPQIHRYIINFPTKRHWRDPSRIEDIETGTVALAEESETGESIHSQYPPWAPDREASTGNRSSPYWSPAWM